MPTTIISSPFTRFGSATPEAGSVRQAFNAEGYGISTSLFAYREGGPIVPASGTTFDTIGAGTLGDPLRLSQFSGFSVPSPILDTFTLTAGIGSLEVVKGNPIVSYGYLGPDYPNYGGGTSPAGSLDNYTFAPTNSTIEALTYFTSEYTSQIEFWVAGQHPNSGWNTMTVYHNYTGTTTVLNRTAFGFDSNPASEGVPAHTWWIIPSSNIFSNTTGGQNTYLITIT